MRGKIFISYRRDDSAGTVHGIAQYLGRAFGRNQVFLDVDMISGTNFPRELSKRLSECSVLLALIGPQWLNVKDAQGRHRLEDPDDWVRLEIGQALKRGIVVIPVMIGAAQLPDKAALPEDLKGLLDHQAARVSTDLFRNDLAGLAKDISMLRGRTRWPAVAAAVVIAVLIAGAGFGAWQAGWFGRAPSRPQASERPAQRAEPTPPSGPVSTADVRARCVRDQKHPDGADIAADLANNIREPTLPIRLGGRNIGANWRAQRDLARHRRRIRRRRRVTTPHPLAQWTAAARPGRATSTRHAECKRCIDAPRHVEPGQRLWLH